jgi:hypothetical protein
MTPERVKHLKEMLEDYLLDHAVIPDGGYSLVKDGLITEDEFDYFDENYEVVVELVWKRRR